jgi:hypothetical protein
MTAEVNGQLEEVKREILSLSERVAAIERKLQQPDPLGRDRREWIERVREAQHERGMVSRG